MQDLPSPAAPKKMSSVKKAGIVFIVLVVVFSCIIIIGSTLQFPPSSKAPQNNQEYTVLTFALYQTVKFNNGTMSYDLTYVYAGEANLLQVTLNEQTYSYSAFAGATYNPPGLKITIVSATERVIVVHVTPLNIEG